MTPNAISQETSINGNLDRTHYDSIFQNSGGTPDTRGLQFGDSAVRRSWQLKTGLVLSPLGRGIYTRPSIRLQYGFQYSSQHAAFGSGLQVRLSSTSRRSARGSPCLSSRMLERTSSLPT